ncbi:MAG: hemerythrin domain-containing protein [Flavobacteriales bacterium]|nr:hemerythrin domain-containing protein [Flavobacteriales bacterium]
MSTSKPLKRQKELQPFSREHHHGLLLCWKIGKGLRNSIDDGRIKKYVDHFYEHSLVQHFEDEEKFVFPILGPENKLVQQALAEHRRLLRLFTDTSNVRKALSKIEEELDAHIRFEERVLFPEIQKVASEAQLQTIDQHHQEIPACEDWDDEFWK